MRRGSLARTKPKPGAPYLGRVLGSAVTVWASFVGFGEEKDEALPHFWGSHHRLLNLEIKTWGRSDDRVQDDSDTGG